MSKKSQRNKNPIPQPAQPQALGPTQALDFVDQACAKFEGTRQDHGHLAGAMVLLRQIVEQWQKLRVENEELKAAAEKAPLALVAGADGLPTTPSEDVEDVDQDEPKVDNADA